MKENVMDILKYLFESYLDDDAKQIPTGTNIRKELSLAGFDKKNIRKAFEWLDDLADLKDHHLSFDIEGNTSHRVYSEFEQLHLSLQARGFLYYMENKGVLNHDLREIVIDRALAINSDKIDLEQMQWITLMVLFNISGSEEAFSWIENIVFEESNMYH